ncbi:MAG TPA: DUF4232 domain-containing protein [Pseudonocardiaceae bacterium]|jgi:hypothetical protein|nr:DUF4232 domain-containing protein [Pseudonocardiaceae bacterium]
MAIRRLVRPTLLVAGGALTIALTAACTGNSNASGTGSDNSATGAVAVASHSTPAAGSTAGNTAGNTIPAANGGQALTSHSDGAGQATVSVKANMDPQQQPGDKILEVTNTGTGPLTLDGFPQLGFLAADNHALDVPTQQVDEPGPATSVTLQPGETAFAGVKLISGDKDDPSTQVATTTTLTVPGAAPTNVTLTGDDGQPIGYPELDLKSVQVGSFQPAAQGVNPDIW